MIYSNIDIKDDVIQSLLLHHHSIRVSLCDTEQTPNTNSIIDNHHHHPILLLQYVSGGERGTIQGGQQ